MPTIYELDGITQRYGQRVVLRIERLLIDEGDTLALIGPSGAGKSTLLRLLCLLETPASGALVYAGNAAPSTAARREVTLVFQRPLLLDTTVRRNIAYGLRVRGRRDDRLVRALIEQLQLGSVADARARTLSGGEIQRVALARALAFTPRVLLLDEPTANLDPRNVEIIERAIGELRDAHGTTIVLATHNLHQARRLATRTAMLLDGSMIEAGPTDRLLESAQDERTRAFVRGGIVF